MQTEAAIRNTVERACAKLPRNVPVSYTTRDGRHFLAYPHSPYDPRLYQLLDVSGGTTDTDLLCTVDDFGDLVPTYRRNPASICGMGFKRIAA